MCGRKWGELVLRSLEPKGQVIVLFCALSVFSRRCLYSSSPFSVAFTGVFFLFFEGVGKDHYVHFEVLVNMLACYESRPEFSGSFLQR